VEEPERHYEKRRMEGSNSVSTPKNKRKKIDSTGVLTQGLQLNR
jgi:hypothetical protein